MDREFQRVVSISEDVGMTTAAEEPRTEQQTNDHNRVGGGGGVMSPQPPQSSGGAHSSTAAVVEPDHNNSDPMEIDAPFRLVAGGGGQSGTFTTNSSLSDGSAGGDDSTGGQDSPMQEQEEPARLEPTKTHRSLDRMDSTNDNDSSSDSQKAYSQNSSRDWGWFEDVHQPLDPISGLMTNEGTTTRPLVKRGGLVPQVSRGEVQELLQQVKDNDASAMAVTAPPYVLEESLSSQHLWKVTAGQRPPQPMEERAFFEKMWAQNFARSQVNYHMPVEVLTATSPISLSPFAEGNFDTHDGGDMANYEFAGNSAEKDSAEGEAALVSRMHVGGDYRVGQTTLVNRKVDGDLTILIRGDNVFGTTVSKSFARQSEPGGPVAGVDTVNISIASYRVVDSKKHGKYAQFLVIYREGSIRDTIGVWKRYRDFEELAKKVTHAHEGCAAVIANMSPLAVTEEPETEHLPNAITSWRLLKKRKRWYRCLDAGYLSLKVFLLERFLHDILFESSSPHLLREFVGGDMVMKGSW